MLAAIRPKTYAVSSIVITQRRAIPTHDYVHHIYFVHLLIFRRKKGRKREKNTHTLKFYLMCAQAIQMRKAIFALALAITLEYIYEIHSLCNIYFKSFAKQFARLLFSSLSLCVD